MKTKGNEKILESGQGGHFTIKQTVIRLRVDILTEMVKREGIGIKSLYYWEKC